MTDINTLINRIDQEIAAEVARQKIGWADLVQANRAREARFQRYETEANRLIELLRPRLNRTQRLGSSSRTISSRILSPRFVSPSTFARPL